jgi:hypothetical protein
MAVSRLFDVKALTYEAGREVYHNVGKVVMYEDGTAKLRLNMVPSQEFRLFEKDKDKFKGRKR